MVNELNIKFEGNMSRVYHPDQTVALLIELRLDKLIKKAKGLRLTINGMASVKWTEGGGRSSVTYQGEQNVLNSINYFFGKGGAEPIEVAAGVHLYKFSSRIPKNAPASAEGKFGFIRYKVDVNLDIPYLPDMHEEEEFFVVRHEDLNRYPELRIANEAEVNKRFCCFLCESEPILIKMSTPRTGFSLGDKIPVSIEIFNQSSVNFIKSLLSLNRVETFNSFTPLQKSKKHITPIIAIFSKGVEARTNVSFSETLNVPNNAAVSNDRICNVFQITYEVKIFMKAEKKSSSVEINVPIYIGSIGFREGSSVSLDSTSLPMDELPPFCKKVQTASAKIPQRFEFIL